MANNRIFASAGLRYEDGEVPECSFCNRDYDEIVADGQELQDTVVNYILCCEQDSCRLELAEQVLRGAIEEEDSEEEEQKVITLAEYAELIGYVPAPEEELTLEAIQTYSEEEKDCSIWDYPLDELEYVLEEVNDSVVLVDVNGETRVCEY